MNASLIDVAIVLIALYIALSVLSSWIQEQIASVMSLRGEKLYRGIVNLVAGSTNLADAIVKHPLIKAAADKEKDQTDPRPSYVEARNFSLALWQSVQQGVGQDAAAQNAGGAQNAGAQNAADDAAKLIALPHEVLASLETKITALPNGELKNTLAALMNAAGADYDKLLAASDAWFESQMDRVSGWYKRTAQWWLVGIGAFIVIVGGIDSIQIAKQAYASPVFSKAFADTMTSVVAKEMAVPSPAPGASAAPVSADDQKRRTTAVAQAVNTALANEPTIKVFWAKQSLPPDWQGWLLKLLGLLITIIAVSLGAPFWFDILKCIVNVRMAGDKPDSTPKKAA